MDNTQRELGYEGAQRAERHANRAVDPEWSAMAARALWAFLAASGAGTVFVASDAARWCLAHGLPAPPDTRAFGNCIRVAAKMGIILDTGRRPRAGSHGREIVEWEIVEIGR